MRHITRTRLLLAALVIGVAVAVPSIAGLASAGNDHSAAAVTKFDASAPARPSQFKSALPPSDTPTAYSGAGGGTRWRIASSIAPIST